MKILQINSVCGVGSTGRIATDIYKVLKDQGHECVIAYGRGNAPQGIDTIKIGTNLDNYIHVAKTRVFDNHGFSSKKATEAFIREAEKYNPDIIHLHNIHGYYINVEVLFRWLKKIGRPVVWTLHDCWPFTGHCAYFDYAGCNKWEKGCSNCHQKKTYPSSSFKDNSKVNYEKKKELFTSLENVTIITPSRWLADLVEKSYLNKYKVKVINNGIDLSVFKPTENSFKEEKGIEGKKMVLGVASVWEERKGMPYILKLAENLDDSYRVVIVGVNEKQKEQLPKGIIGITRTNNVEELAQIYTAADVFVNPTLEDNFPTTNLEALACGTPVITFETGGSPESLCEKSGVIVTKGQCDDLVKAVIDMEKTPAVIDACIKQSKLFDKNDKFLEYVKEYSSLL